MFGWRELPAFGAHGLVDGPFRFDNGCGAFDYQSEMGCRTFSFRSVVEADRDV